MYKCDTEYTSTMDRTSSDDSNFYVKLSIIFKIIDKKHHIAKSTICTKKVYIHLFNKRDVWLYQWKTEEALYTIVTSLLNQQ